MVVIQTMFHVVINVDCMYCVQAIDWTTVELWPDVGSSILAGGVKPNWVPCVAQVGIIHMLDYLRDSRKFQPSDSWAPVLHDAVMALKNRSAG